MPEPQHPKPKYDTTEIDILSCRSRIHQRARNNEYAESRNEKWKNLKKYQKFSHFQVS